jgi:uncharacterized protein (DUF1778 family)
LAREILNLRITHEERDLIDYAAKLSGKTRTDFMLEAARLAAERELMDRSVFVVEGRAYANFVQMLNSNARSNRPLERTMVTASPWD